MKRPNWSSASLFPFFQIFYFVAHVKLYYNNPGYTMFSTYLKIVNILDIVIIGGK